MRFVWATDLHLDHVHGLKPTGFSRTSPLQSFLDSIARKNPDAIVLTGDTSNAAWALSHLQRISEIAPTYFVLGNHDYYGSSIRKIRALMGNLGDPNLWWLQKSGPVRLSNEVGLVGVDGWGDARVGNVHTSNVGLTDWQAISELTYQGRGPMWCEKARRHREKRLQELGAKDARVLEKALREALGRFQKVFVAIHTPPWPEASWYNGKPSDPDWLPWFCCSAAGKAISQCAGEWSDREIVVLCGHTHGHGEATIHPNVRALTGGATYGAPSIQRVFEV
jgi:predicted phosphohydrolase